MRNRLLAYIELTKPRIAMMVLVTAALGYYLGVVFTEEFPGWLSFFFAMLGTGMAGAGASALNQYIERDIDARMDRTRKRPLPAGTLTPRSALYFGVALALGGCLLLLFENNLLTAYLTLQSTLLYVLVYTPLKRLTWLNTSVGAISGAMPPLIGWAAATGTLHAGAWILFAVLYIWQHPHFFAIAWMYRDDYERGGLKMLPVVKPDGKNMFMQVMLFSLVLIPVSMLPTAIGLSGRIYSAGALFLGLAMLACGAAFTLQQTHASAKRVFRMSLIYLPMLLLLILIDAALL